MKQKAGRDITPLVRPKSIALFGCSPGSGNIISNLPLQLLQKGGYPGKLFPINPKYEEVWGLKCYPSHLGRPAGGGDRPGLPPRPLCGGHPDLGRVCPAGVKSVIVGSGGFAEVGGEGIERQQQIREIARASGMRVLGPNCFTV